MRQTGLAGLRVRLLGGADGNGGGSGPLVVLLHGFGAPGDDLVPLVRELRLPESVRFALPEGVLTLPLGGPFYPMAEPRAWWPVDLMRLQEALVGGNPLTLTGEYPEGLTVARRAVISLLDAIEIELGVPSPRIVLGGFSQGAIVSCDVLLHDPRPFAGIIMMSGTLVGEAVWMPRLAARAGTQAFQSHGRMDPLLPFGLAERLNELLTRAQWRTDFVDFSGGHTIAREAVVGLRAFLMRVLPSLTP